MADAEQGTKLFRKEIFFFMKKSHLRNHVEKRNEGNEGYRIYDLIVSSYTY